MKFQKYTVENIRIAHDQSLTNGEPIKLDNLPDIHGSALAAMSYLSNWFDTCQENKGKRPSFDPDEYIEWLNQCIEAMKSHAMPF